MSLDRFIQYQAESIARAKLPAVKRHSNKKQNTGDQERDTTPTPSAL